jgi:hypothetical protein
MDILRDQSTLDDLFISFGRIYIDAMSCQWKHLVVCFRFDLIETLFPLKVVIVFFPFVFYPSFPSKIRIMRPPTYPRILNPETLMTS